jgi:hypothetical protein
MDKPDQFRETRQMQEALNERIGVHTDGMSEPEKITMAEDCACYRPTGRVSLEEAIELVDRAVLFAQERRIPKLLINTTGLTGFPPPSLPQRYFSVRRFANSSQGVVQLALVVQAEMIDPEKFGVLVACNAGMNADVFGAEPEAMAWLLGQRPG